MSSKAMRARSGVTITLRMTGRGETGAETRPEVGRLWGYHKSMSRIRHSQHGQPCREQRLFYVTPRFGRLSAGPFARQVDHSLRRDVVAVRDRLRLRSAVGSRSRDAGHLRGREDAHARGPQFG